MEQRIVDALQVRWQTSTSPQATDGTAPSSTTPDGRPTRSGDSSRPHPAPGDADPHPDATPEAA
jgi:hypothetical protein